MKNIKLTIQYDGTNYCGWQKQKNCPSIQEEIEKAIFKVTGEKVNLIGAGRTDKGVHAQGQVANFMTTSSIPADRFKYALNSKLPSDIKIIESQLVDKSFHSRYDALGKKYAYIIFNREILNPLYRNYSYHIPYGLDYEKMKIAAEYFKGTHDFSAFMASNSSVKNTVRTIYDIDLKKDGELIYISIKGNGFLYNMVRIIVGTLVEVGSGKLSPHSIASIIESKNRQKAGHTAPAKGLYLVEVYY